MADHAQETFAGERVVKAYAQESAEIATFRSTSQEYVRRQLSQIRLTGLLWPTMTLVVGLLIVFLLYAGGRQVAEEGTHDHLLEHNGLYARLYEPQYRDQENQSWTSARR